MNSSTVLTVWDDEKLVGLTRVLDDTEMLAQIHYVLVHPDYQGKGITGKMIEYIKEKYKNFLYRVKKTFRLLLICCVSGSFLIWLICMTLPNMVASIFTSDAALMTYTNNSLRVYLAMLFIYGIQVACQYNFVALDQAPKAIFLTIWRKIIILIPLIFILPHFVPNAVMGVYLAEPIADTIAVCTTAPMFYSYYRKLKSIPCHLLTVHLLLNLSSIPVQVCRCYVKDWREERRYY